MILTDDFGKQNYHMDRNTEMYLRSAISLRLPVEIVPDIYGFKINLGKHIYFFRGAATPFNNASAINVADNKFCSNKILAAAQLPVTKVHGIAKNEFFSGNWHTADLTYPLVIKPTVGTSCGHDVLCGIKDFATLTYHLTEKFKRHENLLIEEFQADLASYRVLVFYGKVIGVLKRIPAQVIGDGKHTIAELIANANIKRNQALREVTFGDLKVDEETSLIFAARNIQINDIPVPGRIIPLCHACNSTRGGTVGALDYSMCKENVALVRKAAEVLNLNVVGFDVACEDIRIPISNSRGFIIEANYHPDVTIHEQPMFGKSKCVSKIMLRTLIYRHPWIYLKCLLGTWFKNIITNLDVFNENTAMLN